MAYLLGTGGPTLLGPARFVGPAPDDSAPGPAYRPRRRP